MNVETLISSIKSDLDELAGIVESLTDELYERDREIEMLNDEFERIGESDD